MARYLPIISLTLLSAIISAPGFLLLLHIYTLARMPDFQVYLLSQVVSFPDNTYPNSFKSPLSITHIDFFLLVFFQLLSVSPEKWCPFFLFHFPLKIILREINCVVFHFRLLLQILRFHILQIHFLSKILFLSFLSA